MAIDMSQFFQVFFEEAAEHLANMEALLLAIDPAAPDPEEVNALFRAAHSIKGSSGTFGFQDMMEVTHILETMLDRVRKGEAPLTNDMVDASLVAGDVLKNLLAAHRGEEEADRAAAEDICHRLELLCQNLDGGNAPAQAAPLPAQAVQAPPTVHAGRTGHLIHFPLVGGVDEQQQVLSRLVAELTGFGEVETVESPAGGYGECHLLVITGAPESDLKGVLSFLLDPEVIRIEAWPVPMAAEDEGFGLFELPPAASTDAAAPPVAAPEEAYGFFDVEEVDQLLIRQQAAEPYGFFHELPPLPDGPEVPAALPVQAEPVQENENRAYGFFVPLPVQAPAEPTPAAPVIPVVVEAAAPASSASQRKPAAAKPAAGGDSGSIRVSVEKVDQMINLVGELVITQAMLTQAASNVDPVVFERLINGLAQLERNTRDLQESVMSIRMMPISVVFSRFPRVVRDLSQKLGKQVELKTIGETTEMDKSLVERITDPLTHLVRNSLDHGLETPEKRRAAGKSETGTITLSAYHQSGNIVIEVGDDGAGLNRGRILAKARERGMQVSDTMTDQEVWQLIMEPGFSTAEQITEVSGRGVGMDVVKKNISAMGGRIELDSMAGVGTRITVRLPLTLAILDGMSVGVGPETYIIPLGYVMESMQPERAMMKSVSGVERLIQVRGEYLPVICLHEVFHIQGAITDWTKGIMVVLEADGQSAALFIDQLIGQHQVVIKSLEANYRRVQGITGATIMGDGRVALILDVPVLVSLARRMVPALTHH
ncbi:chemotaxis protein CheW [Zoogloea sp.]|uniref:chemotaxis protein CheW n=1 Tax=Zoogloea sp. TaxID=49181 RepID=UPI0035ADD267